MYDDTLEGLALDTICPMCEAGPGEWCVSRSGLRTYYLHARRTNPILSAYGHGYAEGESETKLWMERRSA